MLEFLIKAKKYHYEDYLPNISSPPLYIFSWCLFEQIFFPFPDVQILLTSLFPIICYLVTGPSHWVIFKTCFNDIIINFFMGLNLFI